MAHKTSAMVEAGILAAIAIVFALISTYVPVLGMLVNFIWCLPIILCGMRNGLRWSIMTLAVSGMHEKKTASYQTDGYQFSGGFCIFNDQCRHYVCCLGC